MLQKIVIFACGAPENRQSLSKIDHFFLFSPNLLHKVVWDFGLCPIQYPSRIEARYDPALKHTILMMIKLLFNLVEGLYQKNYFVFIHPVRTN